MLRFLDCSGKLQQDQGLNTTCSDPEKGAKESTRWPRVLNLDPSKDDSDRSS